MWTEGGLSFDSEPKLRQNFLYEHINPPYNVFISLSAACWTVVQVSYVIERPKTKDLIKAVSTAPLALLNGCLRQPHAVWQHCIDRVIDNAASLPVNDKNRPRQRMPGTARRHTTHGEAKKKRNASNDKNAFSNTFKCRRSFLPTPCAFSDQRLDHRW